MRFARVERLIQNLETLLPRAGGIRKDRECPPPLLRERGEGRDPHARVAVAHQHHTKSTCGHDSALLHRLAEAVRERGNVVLRHTPVEKGRPRRRPSAVRQRGDCRRSRIEDGGHRDDPAHEAHREPERDDRSLEPVERAGGADRVLDEMEAERGEGSRDRARDREQRERREAAAVPGDHDDRPMPEVNAVGDTAEIGERPGRQHLFDGAAMCVLQRGKEHHHRRRDHDAARYRTEIDHRCRKDEHRCDRGDRHDSRNSTVPAAPVHELWRQGERCAREQLIRAGVGSVIRAVEVRRRDVQRRDRRRRTRRRPNPRVAKYNAPRIIGHTR